MNRSQRGGILLLVLWVVAGLSLVALSVALSVRTETSATRYRTEAEQARFLARGGLEQAAYVLRNAGLTDANGQRFWEPGRPYMEFVFDSGSVRVSVAQESGKLNINTVTPERLEAVLVAAGAGLRQGAALAESVVEWRRELGHKVERLEELLALPGITPDFFYGWMELDAGGQLVERGGLPRLLTVYGAGGPVNLNYAPYEVLLSLPGMDDGAARSLIAGRRKAPYREFTELPIALPLAAQPHVALFTSADVFALVATGRPSGSSVHASIRAVFRRDPLTLQMKLLAWDEVAPAEELFEMTEAGT